MKQLFVIFLLSFLVFGCNSKSSEVIKKTTEAQPFVWEAANVYFMLTDRFYNGNTKNDLNYDRTKEPAKLRGFMGGDMAGITKKIKEGYFDDLGVNAIWFSPVLEQIHDSTDEGTGNTYAFHGYWTKDWTQFDANFGTEADFKELIETAHKHGIRILMDVVLNHTGPVTEKDPVWDNTWVRTEPSCKFKSYDSSVNCTLVKNLPDVLTNSNESVALPAPLVEKWKAEGRYEEEMKELDNFFQKTGLTKNPKNYIIKWLTDYVREYGVDGYRVDTVKHVEESVWDELNKYAQIAFADWKKANPETVLDDKDFFMLGELYGYSIDHKRFYNFGDQKVDYFANGFDNLINFQFKYDAKKDYESIFSKYDNILHNDLKGKSVMNYISSHDDGNPFDKARTKPYESATKLLLTPGISQIYYGDETKRPLIIEGTNGDATLRSFMNWDKMNDTDTKALLLHWQKLGQFRKAHPAIGAGRHTMLSKSPYTFSRTYNNDTVVVALDVAKGKKQISVGKQFTDGTTITDHYSGKTATVENGKVTIDSEFSIVLLHE
ncbi:alpha-amylase family glycosyl hydrolase [Kordia sp.]|uniref:alpha-amylase family glycosyl hydrolase n=1 Tax=Kordia sp. TaxID=1965332 RepID=UPI0025C1842C|nr:alpha-amylase family glycosyl hydrolase [Kordia sp.]MCH2195789.1 alpha-amylase family glycosyl hydrolase [Kordia sp.]